MNKNELATEAVREALRLRADHGFGLTEAVCPFALAEKLGIVTFFRAIPSLEGVYEETASCMLLGSKRPAGRRRYTCAHEIGHHVFRHGVCVEQLGEEELDGWSPKEFVANRFASALLMPKLGITSAFVRRGWSASEPTAAQVFVIAQEFGVGYTTLIGYLERTLRLLPTPLAATLRKSQLPRIRAELTGFPVPEDVFFVDHHRGRHAVELEIDDLLVIPSAARFEGPCLMRQPLSPAGVYRAVVPGAGVVDLEDGLPPIKVCVSRREFVGLARHRHREEVPDDEE